MIECNGISDGFRKVVDTIQRLGVITDSRLGKVIKFPSPVLLKFTSPRQRVLLCRSRCPNPFFHLAEVFWMTSGSNLLKPIELFNSGYYRYSDDGQILQGAYGFRWKKKYGKDQLSEAVRLLSEDTHTRRVVIQIWDSEDLGKVSNDIPCHTQIYLWIENNKLNMTVCNRSNDLVWGLFGSNFVHFTFLMEYLTSCRPLREKGIEMGSYYVFSNNLHAYINEENPVAKWNPDCWLKDVVPCPKDSPLINDGDTFSSLSEKLISLINESEIQDIPCRLQEFSTEHREEPFVSYCAMNFAEYLNRKRTKKPIVFCKYDTWDSGMILWYQQKGYRYETCRLE